MLMRPGPNIDTAASPSVKPLAAVQPDYGIRSDPSTASAQQGQRRQCSTRLKPGHLWCKLDVITRAKLGGSLEILIAQPWSSSLEQEGGEAGRWSRVKHREDKSLGVKYS